jgi:hypothetical protein
VKVALHTLGLTIPGNKFKTNIKKPMQQKALLHFLIIVAFDLTLLCDGWSRAHGRCVMSLMGDNCLGKASKSVDWILRGFIRPFVRTSHGSTPKAFYSFAFQNGLH